MDKIGKGRVDCAGFVPPHKNLRTSALDLLLTASQSFLRAEQRKSLLS